VSRIDNYNCFAIDVDRPTTRYRMLRSNTSTIGGTCKDQEPNTPIRRPLKFACLRFFRQLKPVLWTNNEPNKAGWAVRPITLRNYPLYSGLCSVMYIIMNKAACNAYASQFTVLSRPQGRQSWGLGVATPIFWARGRTVGRRGGRGRVTKYYYILSCTGSMFESGDFWREIEKFAQK